MRTSLVLEKVNFLRGVLDPNTVDGNPGQPGPIFRTAIANYAVAEILRDIGENLKDKTLATQIHSIGKELATESSKSLVTSWDDGDDICPPYHLHFPIPKPGPGPDPFQQLFNLTAHPEPLFDHATPALNDVILAVAIRELASLTTHEKTSTALKQVGENIVKNASTKLYDEYCGTRVKPRIPAPTPHRTAA
jgi:hypothetical protein